MLKIIKIVLSIITIMIISSLFLIGVNAHEISPVSKEVVEQSPQKIVTIYFKNSGQTIYFYDGDLSDIYIISGNHLTPTKKLKYEDGFENIIIELDGDYIINFNNIITTIINGKTFVNNRQLKENSAVIRKSGKIVFGGFNSHNRMPVKEK